MAETTIEWTRGPNGEPGFTFNPWVGCTKISPACDHCYAEGWAKRSGSVQWGGERRRTSETNWRLPLKWNAQAQAEGRRYRVFCASLADVFDNQVPTAWRVDLLRLIEATPCLDWLLLTKRVGNVNRMLDEAGSLMDEVLVWPKPNVWLGATVCNQQEADRDIPKLLATPARVRFLSIEPMLGPVDIQASINRMPWQIGGGDAELHWVICGGESGPGARPMHPDWARSLRDQCAAAGVAFMFKQWGEWADERHVWLDQPIASRLRKTVSRLAADGSVFPMYGPGPEQYAGIYRVGKKAAGRLLDGRTHDGFPGVA